MPLSNRLDNAVTLELDEVLTAGIGSSRRPGISHSELWASRDHFTLEGSFCCVQLRTNSFEEFGPFCSPSGLGFSKDVICWPVVHLDLKHI